MSIDALSKDFAILRSIKVDSIKQNVFILYDKVLSVCYLFYKAFYLLFLMFYLLLAFVWKLVALAPCTILVTTFSCNCMQKQRVSTNYHELTLVCRLSFNWLSLEDIKGILKNTSGACTSRYISFFSCCLETITLPWFIKGRITE